MSFMRYQYPRNCGYRTGPIKGNGRIPVTENHGVWESNINVLTHDDPDPCRPLIGGTFPNANLLRQKKA